MRRWLRARIGGGRQRSGEDAGPDSPPTLAPAFHGAQPEDDIIRTLSPEETVQLRNAYLSGRLKDAIDAVFGSDASLQSVTLLVAQYWSDEAHDAVHGEMIYSELDTPDLEAVKANPEIYPEADSVNLSGRNPWDVVVWESSPLRDWGSNNYCIPLFAALCEEGGHQEGDNLEFFSPVAIYRRTGPAATAVQFVGEIKRPWLEGVSFEFSGFGHNAAALRRWVADGYPPR
jgi:hypothetical protein